MRAISPEEYDKIKYEVKTIDVRTTQENRVLDRFKWADNIPIDELLNNIEGFLPDKNQIIVTVCNAGNRSGQAAEALYEAGYNNAVVLLGGIYGYKRKFGL